VKDWAMSPERTEPVNNPQHTLARAIRLVPERERERYQAEWQYHVANAAAAGVGQAEVASDALRQARHLRARQLPQILSGSYGGLAAVITWVVVGVVSAVASYLGGVVLFPAAVLVVVAIGVLTMTSVRSYWGHPFLVASCLVTAVALAYVWWSTGVAYDPEDPHPVVPPAANFTGIGVVAALLGFVGITVSWAMSATHADRHAPRAR